MKYILLAAGLFLQMNIILAQQRLSGSVIDSISALPLKNVIIRNNTLNVQIYSNDQGRFSMAAQPGHSITFSLLGYHTQTLVLSSLEPLKIFLVPQSNFLKEVEVRHLKTEPSSWQSPTFHGQSMVYQKDYDDPSAGGVVFRVWYWKKDEKRRKKTLRNEYLQKADLRLREIFSPGNMSLYIPLRDSDLENFLWHFTPSPETFTSKNFDLLLYINDSYKKFMQLPEADRKIPDLAGK